MLKPRIAAWMITVATMVFSTGMASGQSYPNKLVRIITSEPGGGLDFAARVIAPGLSDRLGQQVIVDNRGRLASETAVKAPPDGYTILLNGSVHWLMPFLRDNVPWDPVKDFLPITWIAGSPNIIVVHPSLPVRSVKELIALAKARSGEINYSSGGIGGSNHLAGELFRAMAGVDIVHVPFKGTGPALNGLFSGEVQVMFPNAGSVMPHVKSGRLRALAITSAQPSALAPSLPTVAASGVPGYDAEARFAVFAVAKTPGTIVKRLSQEIVAELKRPEVTERFLNTGSVVVASSPDELEAMVKSEMNRMGKVIKDAGIRAD